MLYVHTILQQVLLSTVSTVVSFQDTRAKANLSNPLRHSRFNQDSIVIIYPASLIWKTSATIVPPANRKKTKK